MKGKLAVLGFLCAAITVGGVYATWTFSEGTTPAASVDVSVGLAGEATGTAKGELAVIVNDTTNPLKLLVDDTDNNHVAELLKTGKVIVKFKPADTAPDDVLSTGIKVDLKIGCQVSDGTAFVDADFNAWEYNGAPIFSVATTQITINPKDDLEDGELEWTYDDVNKVFVCEFDVTAATAPFGIKFYDANQNSLEDDIRLDTLEDYNAFKAALAKGQFVFTASEAPQA